MVLQPVIAPPAPGSGRSANNNVPLFISDHPLLEEMHMCFRGQTYIAPAFDYLLSFAPRSRPSERITALFDASNPKEMEIFVAKYLGLDIPFKL